MSWTSGCGESRARLSHVVGKRGYEPCQNWSGQDTRRKQAAMVDATDFKVAPIKTPIEYDSFESVDIRVGAIELVEDVSKSDKLVRLTVDFGDHSETSS